VSIFRKLFGPRNTDEKTQSESERTRKDVRDKTATQAQSKREMASVKNQPTPTTSDAEMRATARDLSEAILSGNTSRCEELLKLNPTIVNEGSPLLISVNQSQTAIVMLLLKRGADVHATNSDGDTALHRAAFMEDPTIASFLVAAGADVNARNAKGQVPLHFVIRRGVAQILIGGGADVNTRDKGGFTPLHAIANSYFDYADIAELLLSSGAVPNAMDNNHQTPLHWAAYNFHRGMVKMLLDHGADINAKDGEGHTALYWASRDLSKDDIFIWARQPSSEAIRETLDLLQRHGNLGMPH
jgi:ankyrin repeat protein